MNKRNKVILEFVIKIKKKKLEFEFEYEFYGIYDMIIKCKERDNKINQEIKCNKKE